MTTQTLTRTSLRWLLACLLVTATHIARADWPLVWDFAGRTDEPVASALGADDHLWLLSRSWTSAGGSRAVLLRIDAQGNLLWATPEPALLQPVALALAPDQRALVLERAGPSLRISAFAADGQIAWSRSRSGLDLDDSSFGASAVPIWDVAAQAWRIPVGLDGDLAVLSYSAQGDALPDYRWTPPAGQAHASSVLPRPQGGLLLSGIVDVNPPGWWTVALAADGSELWRQFEDGGTSAGVFSGAFLLSADPVRIWADDESVCGVFSLRLWSLDPATGTRQWASTWPPTACDSFSPRAVQLSGNRILATGAASTSALNFQFDATALSFDAGSGQLHWVRGIDGPIDSIGSHITSTGDDALLSSTLFPQPNPGPTPLLRAGWRADGTACEPVATAPLPAGVSSSHATSSGSWLVVGSRFSPNATAEDLLVQRFENPCLRVFADGFEQDWVGIGSIRTE